MPPVGWHRTVEQAAQNTTVEAWLNMVVLHNVKTRISTQRQSSSSAGNARIHLEAARALDVHEEAVGLLDQALELVQLGLIGSGRGEQVVVDLRKRKAAISSVFARLQLLGGRVQA